MQARAADHYTLYVGGIGSEADAATLLDLFAGFDALVTASVVRDRATSRCRGYGYVTFTSGRAAIEAQLALDGRRIGPQRLRVVPAL